MGAREIVVVAYDDVELLDVACPGGAFGMAGRAGATPGYRVRLAAPAAGSLRSSCGIWVASEIVLRDLRGPLDTLVIAGGRGSVAAAAPGGCRAPVDLYARPRGDSGPAATSGLRLGLK